MNDDVPHHALASATPRSRIAWPVAIGLLGGAAYAALNRFFDVRFRAGELGGALGVLHDVFDLASPLAVGTLLGLGVRALGLRAEVAALAARREEDLRTRLQHIERDQAVWVVVASALHELRNPIHALGLLLDEAATVGEADPVEAARLVERARDQAARAGGRLAELKAIPSLGRPTLADVEVASLVDDVVAERAPLAAEGGVRIVFAGDADARAHADAAYVRIIVANLLDNAIEASRGAHAHVSVDVGRDDARVRVRIADRGAGLGADASVFDPLRTTKTHGLGLGLSIARALARAMGGDVRHEPTSDGTAFVVELQAAP